MLTHLSISNYAIIENLEIDLKKGFTVITGETGAGKSILLGALNLILGERAESSVLNDISKKCIVEGTFNISKSKHKAFFECNDLDFEENTILRREINPAGKSRAFINDTPVTLTVLKKLTEKLIDIHSQHQTLLVKSDSFQLNVIDSFANSDNELNNYQKKYTEFKSIEKELDELRNLSHQSSADIDYIDFQVNEIQDLKLKPNEKEEIEEEIKLASNAEEIKGILNSSHNLLNGIDSSVLSILKEVFNKFSSISDYSDNYSDVSERLNAMVIELDDISREISLQNDQFAFDAENLSYLNERLGNIYAIEQKHRLNSTQEILDFLDSLKSKLDDFASYDERIQELSLKLDSHREELGVIGKKLSDKRINSFKELKNNILKDLAGLGMPDASFTIRHEMHTEPTINGFDKVEFLFSANKGYSLSKLNKVASGGELSRLMLSIKALLVKHNNLETIIFDEIDTGVSGDIADKMSNIMDKMSNNVQIVSITHLPQVAAKGTHHFRIYKQNKSNKTLTFVDRIEGDDRVEELAKMLSGKELTEAAFENAKVLLKI